MYKKITWIEASAGSGKTTTIVNQINSLLDAGVNPYSILCLSFTNSAADELRKRLNSPEAPLFSTIHGFAMSMLPDSNNYVIANESVKSSLVKAAIEIELNPEFIEILEAAEVSLHSLEQMASEYINDYRDTLSLDKIQQSLDNINSSQITIPKLSKEARNLLKEINIPNIIDIIESHSPKLYLKHLSFNNKFNEQLFSSLFTQKFVIKELNAIFHAVMGYGEIENSIISLKVNKFLRKIADTYYSILRSKKMIHYDDILIQATESMDPLKVMKIQHVFIDEAQDTSDLQANFLQTFFAEIAQHNEYSITIVGDRKQLIYEFNGSSEATFDNLKLFLQSLATNTGAKWSELLLNVSYRSGEQMLKFIDQMMQTTSYKSSHVFANQKKSRICMWSKISTPNQSSIVWQATAEQPIPENIKLCIEKIKELKTQKLLNEDRLVEDSDIMILIPRRHPVIYLLAYELIKNGINISEAPFIIPTNGMIEEFLHVAEFVVSQNDFSILSILKGPFFQWEESDIQNLCCNRESLTVWERLMSPQTIKEKYAKEIFSKWLNLPKNAFQFYSYIFFHTEYGIFMRKFLIEETNLFWEKVAQNKKLNMDIGSFVNYINSEIKSFQLNKKGLTIITMHAAKGRESNIVFLFNSHLNPHNNQKTYTLYKKLALTNQKSCKKLQNVERLNQLKGAERLMYVTITRAREQIYWLPPLNHETIFHNSFYNRMLELYKDNLSQKNFYIIGDT